jgi:glycine oxidase
MYDVIIIGGGVIGASIAYHLSQHKKKVLLIEKNQIGQQASRAAAGMLGLQTELQVNSPLFALGKASIEIFRDLIPFLEEKTNIPLHFNQTGLLRISLTEAEWDDLCEQQKIQSQLGLTCQLLSKTEVKRLEPSVSDKITGGFYVPNGQLEAPNLTPALIQAAQKNGLKFMEHTSVERFIIHQGQVCGVKTERQEEFYAENVVLTIGACTNQLLPADLHFPLYPVKGEAMMVKLTKSCLSHTLFTKDVYLVPKAGNRVLIGATEVPHVWDRSISAQGIYSLMEQTQHLCPLLLNGQIDKIWSGLRPQTKDELPILGPDPDLPGLFHACGHYRNGILLSAITGVITNQILTGRSPDFDLTAFSPKRWRVRTCSM